MTDTMIVDVSRYQLVTPVANSTVHVYLAKSTQGQKKYAPDDQVENTFMMAQLDQNALFSPYHYFWRQPTDVASGRKQAEHMARVLEALVSAHGGKFSDMNWKGRPIVWLDVENVQTSLGEPDASQNWMENQIWKFINNIDSLLGADVGIYTSKYGWTTVTGPGSNRSTDIPRDRALWVSNPGSQKPAIPWDWEKRYGPECWSIWQYSFTGKVNGIMKPYIPAVQATVDLNKANGNLDWFNRTFGTSLTPKAIAPPVEPPVVTQPKRVEIEMQSAAERLNLRSSPFGGVCAQTWDGVQFPVIGSLKDSQGRDWWQIGPELFVASWYCKAV